MGATTHNVTTGFEKSIKVNRLRMDVPVSKLPVFYNTSKLKQNYTEGYKLTTKYIKADRLYKINKNFYTIGNQHYLPSENGGI